MRIRQIVFAAQDLAANRSLLGQIPTDTLVLERGALLHGEAAAGAVH